MDYLEDDLELDMILAPVRFFRHLAERDPDLILVEWID